MRLKVLRARSFGGGFRFTRYAGQPDSSVSNIGVPDKVIIPLLQGFGVPLSPLVQPGDHVVAGQIIGRDDTSVSSPVHASVAGTVVGIAPTEYNGRTVEGVAIAAAQDDRVAPLPGFSPDWERLSPAQIEELLYLSGVTALGTEGIPTRFRSSVIEPSAVKDVIIHQTGSDAFNPRAEVILAPAARDRFVSGLKMLLRVMPGASFHIALSSEEKPQLAAIGQLVSGLDRVRLHSLTPRYPQDLTELLVITALGKPFPFGYSAANIGVVVLNAQTVLHAYEAVAEGRPLIERLIALSGPGFVTPTHVRVRVGTPIERVVAGRLRDEPVRIIRDSLLAGVEVKDRARPVTRVDRQLIAALTGADRQVLAFARPGLHRDSWSRAFAARVLPLSKEADTNQHGELRPCISCGWCSRVCPVRIIPHLITRTAQRVGISENLVRLGVFNCIDCNLCSFVCPSKIPLGHQMLDTKQKLLETGCDNSSCVLPKFDLRGVEEYKGVKSIR